MTETSGNASSVDNRLQFIAALAHYGLMKAQILLHVDGQIVVGETASYREFSLFFTDVLGGEMANAGLNSGDDVSEIAANYLSLMAESRSALDQDDALLFSDAVRETSQLPVVKYLYLTNLRIIGRVDLSIGDDNTFWAYPLNRITAWSLGTPSKEDD